MATIVPANTVGAGAYAAGLARGRYADQRFRESQDALQGQAFVQGFRRYLDELQRDRFAQDERDFRSSEAAKERRFRASQAEKSDERRAVNERLQMQLAAQLEQDQARQETMEAIPDLSQLSEMMQRDPGEFARQVFAQQIASGRGGVVDIKRMQEIGAMPTIDGAGGAPPGPFQAAAGGAGGRKGLSGRTRTAYDLMMTGQYDMVGPTLLDVDRMKPTDDGRFLPTAEALQSAVGVMAWINDPATSLKRGRQGIAALEAQGALTPQMRMAAEDALKRREAAEMPPDDLAAVGSPDVVAELLTSIADPRASAVKQRKAAAVVQELQRFAQEATYRELVDRYEDLEPEFVQADLPADLIAPMYERGRQLEDSALALSQQVTAVAGEMIEAIRQAGHDERTEKMLMQAAAEQAATKAAQVWGGGSALELVQASGMAMQRQQQMVPAPVEPATTMNGESQATGLMSGGVQRMQRGPVRSRPAGPAPNLHGLMDQ